jgi:hypothetical protein
MSIFEARLIFNGFSSSNKHRGKRSIGFCNFVSYLLSWVVFSRIGYLDEVNSPVWFEN